MLLGSIVNTFLIGCLGTVSRLRFVLQMLEQDQPLITAPPGTEDK